jgi:hypothetical protein
MTSVKDLTAADRQDIEKTIENAFEFVRDVVNQPDVLNEIPDGSEIVLTPAGEITPGVRTVARTQRFFVGIKQPSRPARPASQPSQRIGRGYRRRIGKSA